MLPNSIKDLASAIMYAAEAGSLEAVLQRIAEISRDLVHARYAALGVPDDDGGLRYFKTAGLSQEEIDRMAHLPRGLGLIGASMHAATPIRIERIQDDPRSVGFPRHHPQMTTLLGVPIRVGQQLLGVLYLCDREDGKPFSAEDQRLIETMAGYAALAIVGMQLSERQRRFALLEERERISMELHDGVIQSLYALGMQLELYRTSEELHSRELKPIINGLNTVIDDIRAYILNLKTQNLQQTSTVNGLRDTLAQLRIPDTIAVQISAPDEPPPFSPRTFESVCQIVHEALSNVVRHANASQIDVTVSQNDSAFEIVIHDNGQGFDLDKTNNGLGLPNIQKRAQLHGGQMRIETSPGFGTRLTITIPPSRGRYVPE